MEETLHFVNPLMELLKRGTRDSSNPMKYKSLSLFYKLLEHFAKDRNPFAAVIYKKLTFSVIENH